ncbi:hypothetical protein evm_013594 [Chilo suppressalis]|nr:hypothetical protein evm_013594 [Chilo suppressalis]
MVVHLQHSVLKPTMRLRAKIQTIGGRWCPFILFQRRWHQLKEETRIALTPGLGVDGPAVTPHPLHWIVAVRWPHVLTDPLPSWTQLMQLGLVYDLEDSKLDQVESIEPVDEQDDRDDFLKLATRERLDEIRKRPRVQKGTSLFLDSLRTMYFSNTQPTQPNTNLTPPTQGLKSRNQSENLIISNTDESENVLNHLESINPDRAEATIIFESDDENLPSEYENKGHDRIKVERHSDDEMEIEVRYPVGASGLNKSRLKFEDDDFDEERLPLSLTASTKGKRPCAVGNRDDYHLKKIADLKTGLFDDLSIVKKEKDGDNPVEGRRTSVRIKFEEDSDVPDAFDSTDGCTVDEKLLMETRVVLERLNPQRLQELEAAKNQCESETPSRPVSLPQGSFTRSVPVAEVKPLLSVNPLIVPNNTPTPIPNPIIPQVVDRLNPIPSEYPLLVPRNFTYHNLVADSMPMNDNTAAPSEREEGGVCSGQQLADMIQEEVHRVTRNKVLDCCSARALCVRNLAPRSAKHSSKIKLSSCCAWLVRESPPSVANMQRSRNRLRQALQALTVQYKYQLKQSDRSQASSDGDIEFGTTESAVVSSEEETTRLVIDETKPKKSSERKTKPPTTFQANTKDKKTKLKKPRNKNKKKAPEEKDKRNETTHKIDVKCTSQSRTEDDQDEALKEWMRQKNDFKKYFTIKPISPVKAKVEDSTPTTSKRADNTVGHNETFKNAAAETTKLTKETNPTEAIDLTEDVEQTKEQALIKQPIMGTKAVLTKDEAIQTKFAVMPKKPRLSEEFYENNKIALTKEAIQKNEAFLSKKETQTKPTVLSNPLLYIADMMQRDPVNLFVLQNRDQTKIMITKGDKKTGDESECRYTTPNLVEHSATTSKADQHNSAIEIIDSDEDEKSDDVVIHVDRPVPVCLIKTNRNYYNNKTTDRGKGEPALGDLNEQKGDIDDVKGLELTDPGRKEDSYTAAMLADKNEPDIHLEEHNVGIDEDVEIVENSVAPALIETKDEIADEAKAEPVFVDVNERKITIDKKIIDVDGGNNCEKPKKAEANPSKCGNFTVNVLSRDLRTDQFKVVTTTKIDCHRVAANNNSPYNRSLVKDSSAEGKCQCNRNKGVVRLVIFKLTIVAVGYDGRFHHYHHQPINVPTAGAQAFPIDGIGRLGHDPPRGPSADWRVLTTADAAGTNGLTCLPKHGGTRDRRFLVTHPMTVQCESCLTSTIAAKRANHHSKVEVTSSGERSNSSDKTSI